MEILDYGFSMKISRARAFCDCKIAILQRTFANFPKLGSTGLITVFAPILPGRQGGQKLQYLYGN